MLFSSHNLNEVERLCNKVAFIKSGSIFKDGTIENMEHILVKNFDLKIHVEDESLLFQALTPLVMPEITFRTDKHVELKFTLKNDIGKALEIISKFHICDLTITSPSLEELFKSYYQEAL